MKKALLIGINNYPGVNKLGGCIEDINQVKAVIERNGNNSPNFDVRMMPDVQTSAEALGAINQLFSTYPLPQKNRTLFRVLSSLFLMTLSTCLLHHRICRHLIYY